jgi:hypothetical protein
MAKEYDYTDLAIDIHKNAVAHGWWEGDREVGEVFALFLSEASEALEEYRNGKPPIYFMRNAGQIGKYAFQDQETDLSKWNGEKPEGIVVELADVVIRLFDASQVYDWGLEKFKAYKASEMPKQGQKRWKTRTKTFGTFILLIQQMITAAYDEDYDDTNDIPTIEIDTELLQYVISYIFTYCNEQGWDIDTVIRLKHKYNKTRPYKHGNKVI